MADIESVIKIPEDLYKATVNGLDANEIWDLRLAVANGTPLEKVLGDIKAEIDMKRIRKNPKNDFVDGYNLAIFDVLQIINKYKAESEE